MDFNKSTFFQHKNGAISLVVTLGCLSGTGLGTFTVTSGLGAAFGPLITNGARLVCWAGGLNTSPNIDPNLEIIWVTGISTDTFTVSMRGLDNTLPFGHSGTIVVANFALDDDMNRIEQGVNRLESMVQAMQAADDMFNIRSFR
jgi:hypothetical protein